MKFKLNSATEGSKYGTIPTEKRGVILPSTKEATEKRQALAMNAPNKMGRKIKEPEETE